MSRKNETQKELEQIEREYLELESRFEAAQIKLLKEQATHPKHTIVEVRGELFCVVGHRCARHVYTGRTGYEGGEFRRGQYYAGLRLRPLNKGGSVSRKKYADYMHATAVSGTHGKASAPSELCFDEIDRLAELGGLFLGIYEDRRVQKLIIEDV